MSLPAFEANGMSLAPGIQLLEASAGTGKTFALAHLVLRLLSEGPRPLSVDQLLVVTFTDAAAAELRDRIARRLQEALEQLDQPTTNSGDAPLQQWRSAWGAQPPPALRGRLLLALEQLDRADITTIHGFCRRTLQRQALEAGLGPAVTLETEARERRIELVHDYWSQQLLPLPPGLLAGLQQRQLHPDALVNLLGSLDGDPALQLDPLPEGLTAAAPLAPQLTGLWSQRWHHFLAQWQQHSEALEIDFAAAANELKSLGVPNKPYRLKPKPDKLQRVQAWIDGLAPDQEAPSYQEVLRQSELLSYFHPGTFTKTAAAAHGEAVSLPQRPLLEAIADLVDGPAELVLLHFAHWSRGELAQRRERSGQIGFGQLLEQLDPGPDPERPSPLLAAVAERYRAALIDEFQDTDPIQWRILQRAFGQQPARHLLVMVGDPKQAIYRFRGGELATYRQAAAAANACYGLTQNRRSSDGLVAGLNALMEPGLVRSKLAVPAVQPMAEKGCLQLPRNEAPLQVLPLEPSQLDSQVAALCQQLLERGLTLEQEDTRRPLQAGDLCVLVSRHSQAESLRMALERRQLPSRLVSRGDVFESLGAAALQRLLDALASPGDPGRLRLLAASALLGWSAAEIQAASPEQWDQLAEALSQWTQRLRRIGLMGVLGELLGTDGLARLSLRGRALADLQQAAELVQEQMHSQGLGALAAADWLRNLRLQDDRDPPDDHLCRSDAAESAIAVVTVHRSKGLEYPVVICPHLWRAPAAPKAGGRRPGRRWLPPGSSEPHLDLHLNPHWGQGRAAAKQDRDAQLQEAERLAYVACTRARHLLVLGWPGPQAAESGNPLVAWLEGRDGLPLHAIAPDSLPPAERTWQPQPSSGRLELGPRPSRNLDSRWGRASYSAWAHSDAALAPQTQDEGRDTDALSSDGLPEEPIPENIPKNLPKDLSDNIPSPWPDLGPLARFPRGAGPGDALHRMLEQIHFAALARDPEQARPLLSQELERAGLEASHLEPLLEGLQQLVRTPLGGELGSCCLADLPEGSWLSELSFDLPLAQTDGSRLVRSSGLAAAFEQHPGGRFGADYGRQLRGLNVASRGFLTGSIDLVFQWQERWWVVDWKSNWLGRRDGQGQVLSCGPNDYHQAAMAKLMASSHYPLQAHLYLVALHRYLHWRLPGYNPQHHLGGYAYVFLRGVPGPVERPEAGVPGVLVDSPPLQRLLALDALLREGQP
jgi:exodeoxyribonuclease V beta subunit